MLSRVNGFVILVVDDNVERFAAAKANVELNIRVSEFDCGVHVGTVIVLGLSARQHSIDDSKRAACGFARVIQVAKFAASVEVVLEQDHGLGIGRRRFTIAFHFLGCAIHCRRWQINARRIVLGRVKVELG